MKTKIKGSTLTFPVGFKRDSIKVDFLEKDILFTLKKPTRMFAKKQYKERWFQDSFHFCFHLDEKEKSRFQEIEERILSQYVKHPQLKDYYWPEPVVQNDHLFVYNMLLFCDKELEKMEKEIWENLEGDDEKAPPLLLELDRKDREQKEQKKYVWDHMQHQINKIPLRKDINKKIEQTQKGGKQLKNEEIVSFPIGQDEIDYEELFDLVIPTFRIYGVMLQSAFTHLHLAIALDSIQIVLSPEKRQMASLIHATAMDEVISEQALFMVAQSVNENLLFG